MLRNWTDWFKREPVWVWLALFAVIVVGTGLRFYHANVRPFWLDEIHTYQVVNEPKTFVAMMKFWWHTMVVADPPLFYMFNYPLVGGNQYAPLWQIRFITILFGILTIPVVWMLVRQFTSNGIAVIAASFAAINTFGLQYSQEYRPYTQLLFFCTLYMYSQVKVFRTLNGYTYTLLLISGIGLIYTHYFGGLTLAVGYMAWGIALLYKKIKVKKIWIAYLATPLIITISFLPIIIHGLWRAKTLSVTGDAGSELATALLNEYLNKKSYANFWTDLPKFLVAGYLSHLKSIPVLLFITLLGMATMAWAQPRWFILSSTTTLAVCAASYAFYEVMKYPYEARRNIGLIPVIAIWQAYAVLMPVVLTARHTSSPTTRYAARFTSGLLIAITTACYAYQFWYFDSAGHRNQPYQADWEQMAAYVKSNALPDDFVIAYDTGSLGNQFDFFLMREKHPMQMSRVSDLEGIRNSFRQRPKSTGAWCVLCFPSSGQGDGQVYMQQFGKWKNFFGGSLVYLSASAVNSQVDGGMSIASRSGYYGMDLITAEEGTRRIAFTGPVQLVTLQNPAPDHSVIALSEGVVHYSTDMPSTVTLAPYVKPDQWQQAMDFQRWESAGGNLDFIVDDQMDTALFMQYNGTMDYAFYSPTAYEAILSIKAKNDAPGPIELRVFSEPGELPRYRFDKGDNSFGIISHPMQVKAGVNRFKIYYPSFRRIEYGGSDPNDGFNECVISAWKITPATVPAP